MPWIYPDGTPVPQNLAPPAPTSAAGGGGGHWAYSDGSRVPDHLAPPPPQRGGGTAGGGFDPSALTSGPPGVVGRALAALPQDPYQQAMPGHQQLGWPLDIAERGTEVLGAGLGGALGGAGGTMVGGPVGGFAGGVAGADVGMTGADTLLTKLNQALGYGGAPISMANTLQAAKANLPASILGEAGTKLLPAAWRGVTGQAGMEEAARTGGAEAESAATAAQGAVSAGGKALQEQAATDIAAQQAKLGQRILPVAQREAAERQQGLVQQMIGKTPEETRAGILPARMRAASPGQQEWGGMIDTMTGPRTFGGRAVASPDLPFPMLKALRDMPPADAMKTVFDSPDRALAFAKRLNTPEMRGIARDRFADAVNLKKIVPSEDMVPAMRRLGFTGPLTKPAAWDRIEYNLDNLPKILEQNPRAAAQFKTELGLAQQKALDETNEEILRLGEKQLKGLPAKTREGITAQISAAKTPQEKADAVLKAFGMMDPKQAQLQGAVEAVGTYNPQAGRFGQRMKFMMQRRMMIGGVALAVGGAGGAPALGGMAAIGAGMGARSLLRRGWIYSVRSSPEAASAYARAVLNPGAPGAFRSLTTSIVAGASAVGTKELTEAPDPALITDRTDSPGPMGKAIERAQAIKVSTSRGQQDPQHLDNLQELQEDIAKGKHPDVHRDLNSGRLSAQEIRKLVDSQPQSINTLFDGMSIDEAMTAFSQGTPEEKEIALPALVQKIQNEGKNMPPQQRQMLLMQLKKALPDQAPTLPLPPPPQPGNFPPQGMPPPQQAQVPPQPPQGAPVNG